MNRILFIYIFSLFVITTPNFIFKIPIKNHLVVVLIHAVIFSCILYFTYDIVNSDVIESVVNNDSIQDGDSTSGTTGGSTSNGDHTIYIETSSSDSEEIKKNADDIMKLKEQQNEMILDNANNIIQLAKTYADDAAIYANDAYKAANQINSASTASTTTASTTGAPASTTGGESGSTTSTTGAPASTTGGESGSTTSTTGGESGSTTSTTGGESGSTTSTTGGESSSTTGGGSGSTTSTTGGGSGDSTSGTTSSSPPPAAPVNEIQELNFDFSKNKATFGFTGVTKQTAEEYNRVNASNYACLKNLPTRFLPDTLKDKSSPENGVKINYPASRTYESAVEMAEAFQKAGGYTTLPFTVSAVDNKLRIQFKDDAQEDQKYLRALQVWGNNAVPFKIVTNSKSNQNNNCYSYYAPT